jgi:hypothetical protein
MMRNEGHVQRNSRTAHACQIFVIRVEPYALGEGEDIAEFFLIQHLTPAITQLLGGLKNLLPGLGVNARQFP